MTLEILCSSPIKGELKIGQGFNSVGRDGGTHIAREDADETYSLDIEADVGTRVYTMRAGILVAVEDRYDVVPKEGLTEEAWKERALRENNYIFIFHPEDDTVSFYAHLQQNGVDLPVKK